MRGGVGLDADTAEALVTEPIERDQPPGSPSPTLARIAHPPAIAWTGDGKVADPLIANEGRTYTHEGSHNFRLRNCVSRPPSGVRRLTPRECERLQGFPDDWTLIPPITNRSAPDAAATEAYLIASGYHPAEAALLAATPDGARYKAIGNSMAVPVIRWILERILHVDRLAAALEGVER